MGRSNIFSCHLVTSLDKKNKIFDVCGEKAVPKTQVIIYKAKGEGVLANQQWEIIPADHIHLFASDAKAVMAKNTYNNTKAQRDEFLKNIGK